MIEIRLPQWGMGMQEGTVVRWLKGEGESVEKNEPLVEVEAEKVTEEVDSPSDGTLERVLVAEGEVAKVRDVLGTISTEEEGSNSTEDQREANIGSDAKAAPVEAEAAGNNQGSAVPEQPTGKQNTKVHASPRVRRLANELSVDLNSIRGSGPSGRTTEADVRRASEDELEAPAPSKAARPVAKVQASPRVRRLAGEASLNLNEVRGSGPGGRVTENDVRKASEVRAAGSKDTPENSGSPGAVQDIPTGEVVPISGTRATIAQRMHGSLHSMAQLTLTTEVDVTELVRQRETLASQFSVTYNDLVVKAVASALGDHPRMNAWIQGEEIHLLPDAHIGMAVALEEGLVVPVLRDAARKSLREISEEAKELARRAREGDLEPAELSGSSFTVTNLGSYGIDAFTPIINPPEVGILGVGRITEKISRGNTDSVWPDLVWRRVMALSLTFDHRAVDGAPAAAFLQAVSERLQHPERLAEEDKEQEARPEDR